MFWFVKWGFELARIYVTGDVISLSLNQRISKVLFAYDSPLFLPGAHLSRLVYYRKQDTANLVFDCRKIVERRIKF